MGSRRALLGGAVSLAVLVAAAGSAEAAAPQLGRCVKASVVGKGSYSSSSCTKAKAHGNYEWKAGAVKTGFTLSATRPLVFEAGPESIVCAGAHGSGQYSSSGGVANVVLTYTGCAYRTLSCQNTATAGEIRTAPMVGGFGIIKAGATAKSNVIGLDVAGTGPGGEVLHYVCGISSNDVVGSVIVPFKANRMATTTKLAYAEAASHQLPEAFEGEPRDVLERQIEPGVFEQTGMSGTLTATGEEPLEVNSVL